MAGIPLKHLQTCLDLKLRTTVGLQFVVADNTRTVVAKPNSFEVYCMRGGLNRSYLN